MTETQTDPVPAVPAVRAAAGLAGGAVRAVAPSDSGSPTPCADFDVREVLDHLGWAAQLFQHSAARTAFEHDWSVPEPAPSLTGPPEEWGEALAADLERTAEAWADPAAWEGETLMAAAPMPASFVGPMLVAELALHGWDVARAVGHPYDVPDDVAATTLSAVESMAQMGRDGGWYGPEVDVHQGASVFDRALGLSGRDPGWTPAG